MQALKTSFYRLHPSRILGFSRGRKWLLSTIRPLESSLYPLEKVEFSAGEEAENDFKVPFDHLNNCFLNFTQIEFWAGQVVENDFAMPLTNWNIAFWNSHKRHFMLVKRLKISSRCLATPSNIAFSTSPKSHFGWSRGWKWVRSAWRTLQTSLYQHHLIRKRKEMNQNAMGAVET